MEARIKANEMSQQRKIGEVFLDERNGKRLKCVENGFCQGCAYFETKCNDISCCSYERDDMKNVSFVQTDEPLTEKLLPAKKQTTLRTSKRWTQNRKEMFINLAKKMMIWAHGEKWR